MISNIAVQVAAREWFRYHSLPAALPPAASQTGDHPTVELFIDEAWHDITRLDQATPGVYYRDAIQITRGRADEGAQTDRSRCTFTLNNRDGRFSPRNPLGPYYGKIGRNTPCRVSIVRNGVRRYRFHGEISEWPVRWDISGSDVWTEIEASGVLRRLGQGTSPLDSSMYRGISRYTTHMVTYWPCEDVEGSTFIASAVSGVKQMTIKGTPTLASNEDFVASAALPVMGSAKFTGTIPSYSTSLGEHQLRFVMKVPAAGATNGQVLTQMSATTGTIVKWELYYGTGGTLGLRGFDGAGTNVADTGAYAFAVNGKALRVSIELHQLGADVQYGMVTLEVGQDTGLYTVATETSATVGRVTQVVMAANQGLTDTVMGHVTFQNRVTSIFDLAADLRGYTAERSGTRFARLCAEERLNFQRIGDTSTDMGVQGQDGLLDLLRECVEVDTAVMFEPRDQIGLGYRDHNSLHNQAAKLALDYAGHELSDSLAPTDDDQFIRNDVTVTRKDGSSARAELASGALSTDPPPDGIGRYDEGLTLNLYQDSQLDDQAGWRMHLGTVDEARYPSLSLNLRHSTFTSDTDLMNAVLTMDLGDRITIDNPPEWTPPDQISLILQGYTETLGFLEHDLELTCSPESPHHVGVYDSTDSRYSSDGSELGAAVTGSATSLTVATTSDTQTVWSDADQPFDIVVGGERMTVTAVSGASSPQTFTVTRSVNGIVKAHAAGAEVALFRPVYYAL